MTELAIADLALFEGRRPPLPVPYSERIEAIWQVLAVASGCLGLWYIHWRWTASLNHDALGFSMIVATAETLTVFGMFLFFHNIWTTSDTPQAAPPRARADCQLPDAPTPIEIDIFIATHDEPVELLQISVKDAVAVTVPSGTTVRVWLLDDGNRPVMRDFADHCGISYLARANNHGFKAGNLKHALSHSSGDFVVICDADTRLFSTFLTRTMGYFRDPNVAWVQTPHWFYDIPQGRSLTQILRQRWGKFGARIGAVSQVLVGPINLGRDPFSSEPGLFFDVIQRRRNVDFASFCCGAGSIHRREALMAAALRELFSAVESGAGRVIRSVSSCGNAAKVGMAVSRIASLTAEFTPFKFHVSEDIYTSIRLHSDRDKYWKSVFHPHVESKMLSPWTMRSWVIQNFKYAGGTFHIMLSDNPLFRQGMTMRRKLFYAATFWSYLSALWTPILLVAPIITLLTGVAPVDSYSGDFFLHLVPLLLVHEMALATGTRGHATTRGKWMSVSMFWVNLQALTCVLRGRQIKFLPTPKTRRSERYLRPAVPHMVLLALTLVALLVGLTRAIATDDPAVWSMLVVNGFWGVVNILALSLMVRAAFWTPSANDFIPDVQTGGIV